MREKKQKLELTWIGKDKLPRLEPRILLEQKDKSHHAKVRISPQDIYDNVLIHGDNLLALKALEQEYSNQVKCIYIDPPFNTGQAFTHYDDGIEHSLWLGLMRDRLVHFKQLLAPNGFIFVHIDYRESARLKLLMDEVFGAQCFRNEIIVGRGTKNVQSQFDDIDSLASGHDTIYLYSKSPSSRLKTLYATVDEPQPGKWDTFWRGTDRPTMRYELFGITPEKGQWRWSRERAYAAKQTYEIYSTNFSSIMSLDEYWKKLTEETGEKPNIIRLGPEKTVQYYVGPRNYKMLSDVWFDLRTLGKITDFSHEKHEELLQRIIEWVTEPGEIVLDSFAGSGTSAATAHKLYRKWITVELGDHCDSHVLPRLKRVVEGKDDGGITKNAGWKGGGGFRFYKLAPSMLEKDKWGKWIISKQYNAAMLAEALCKVMGFKYSPSEESYWIHGHSNESDYIYVTTQTLDHAQLAAISEEVGDKRSLLICCCAFRAKADEFPNLTLKKIPRSVLSKCEWGKDDYSLNVQNLPMAKEEPKEPTENKKQSKPAEALPLFESN